jgi:hypothetical protein
MKAAFVALALPGFVLLCLATASLPLRRTRRYVTYLSAPGAGLYGTALIISGATGMSPRWQVTAGAIFIAIAAVNAAGLLIVRRITGKP